MPNVQILLKDNVEDLGRIGDIVSVKPGYARNYLLPKGFATLPTIGEIRQVEKKKALLEKDYQEAKVKAEELVTKLNEFGAFEIIAKAGDSGKLFGSITTKDIAEKLNEKLSVEGVKIERKQIQLKKAIHEIGQYTIKLKLHNEVHPEVTLEVKAEEKE